MNIRKVKFEDENKFLNMLLSLDKETEYMMFEPNERPNNIDRIHEMIRQCIDGDNLLLVATEDNDIIGFLSAQRGVANRIKHTAYIVVGIRAVFRGMGIGKALFSKLDLWARENGVTRLELTVMCPNTTAKYLYEQSGFEVEGIKKNSMLVDGKYVDEYYMAKLY
ncbi:GNAT family N-acetyltransferase [Clostridium carnis]